MKALDTNVLVRLLIDDDATQSARVVRFLRQAFAHGERCFVSDVVLAELSWVLARSYKLQRRELAALLVDLLQSEQLVFQSEDAAARAVARYAKGGAELADYLVAEIARDHDADRVVTFDARLLREPGFRQP